MDAPPMEPWRVYVLLSPAGRRLATSRAQVAASRRELCNLLTRDEHHVIAAFARLVERLAGREVGRRSARRRSDLACAGERREAA